jgi:hypothetical protein
VTGWYAAGIVFPLLGLNMAVGLYLIRRFVRAHRQADVDQLEAKALEAYQARR